MRCSSFATVLAGLVLALGGPAYGQNHEPSLAAGPLRFESWRPAVSPDATSNSPVAALGLAERDRTRRALVGGAIGAAAGVVFCTAVSTLTNDSAEGGVSFCPLDSYLLIGGAGFVLGAVIGWVT